MGDPDRSADLLRAYDDQLRGEVETLGADTSEWHGLLLWGRFDDTGFVSHRGLDVDDDELDRLIGETVAHFRDETDVAEVEWKTRGHDRPDLPDRLRAHGFEADEEETVMIGEASLVAVEVPLPEEVSLRLVTDGPGVEDDLARMLAMQADVFGDEHGTVASMLEGLRRGDEHWVAEVDGEVVGAGRLVVVEGTDFAGVWGGSVVPAWRGKGIYRALVAARARTAIERGFRFVQSDCTPMSRPILERSGLQRVTTTTPYLWRRDKSAALS